ncbi:MAG TPA: glycosyltransferase family 4 protein [Caulobacteraceae bacterium]|nr:glycosyltransferase family 4 protein [Caulobacteraceae bacterium]
MRIAQVAPLYEAVPPKLYGGTERVVAYLADALTELGHEVTLFAAGGSSASAELFAARPQAIRLDPTPLKSDLAAHLSMLAEVRRRKDRFDLIHFHTDMLHFPMFEDMPGRTLTTLHGRLDLADIAEVYRRWRQFPVVSISNAQRRHLPFANWAGTVYHGLPTNLHRFSAAPRGYLAFLGRISPEKGPERAIAIAKRAGVPLKIAAKVDPADKVYFEECVQPLLDHPLIEYIGEIGEADKSDFLGGADALLFPVNWPEPFGLVMIEAMACGTPVIAYRCGSTEEVVEDGRSGFLVGGEAEAVTAIDRARSLDRREIRRRFDHRFTSAVMARNYLDIYSERLAKSARTIVLRDRTAARPLASFGAREDKSAVPSPIL